MDKNWDRNPSNSEVIGRCGEDEKPTDRAENLGQKILRSLRMTMQNQQKLNAKKTTTYIVNPQKPDK